MKQLLQVEALHFFLGFFCNCFSCFITTRITFTSILYLQCIYMIYIITVYTPLFIYSNRCKLNSLLTYYLVEHHTSILKVRGSNTIEASEISLGYLCNCFSCFITARITFTSILYPQCIYCISHTHHRQTISLRILILS